MVYTRIVKTLDEYIDFWKRKEDEEGHEEIAPYYIDAYSTVKEMLEEGFKESVIPGSGY